MAIKQGRYARMYLDDLDVYLRSFEMDQTIESVTADASRYGDNWEIHEVVQGKGGININAYLDDVYSQGEPDAAVNNALDLLFWKAMTNDSTPPTIFQTPATLTFIPFDTPVAEDDGVLFMQGYGQFALAPAVKGLIPIRSQFVGAGPLNRGKILAIGTLSGITSAAPFVGVPINFTAPTNFVRASMHCFSFVSAVTATLTASLESDPDDPFTGGGTTRLTFPTFTGRTGAYAEVALNNSDDEYRLRITSNNAAATAVGIIVVGHTL